MEPLREDGRRCLTEQEMREKKGWRPLTQDEMLTSTRQRARAEFGVEMWISPAARDRARVTIGRKLYQQDASQGVTS